MNRRLHLQAEAMDPEGVEALLRVVAPFAGQLGLAAELRTAAEEAPGPLAPRWRQATLLALSGDHRGAAEVFVVAGSLTREADARGHAGERLLDFRLNADAEIELAKAMAFYRSVEATYYVETCERLLTAAQVESA